MKLSGRSLFVGLLAAGSAAYVMRARRPFALPAADAVDVIPLKRYGAVQARFLLWRAGLRGVEPANAVDCYRVIYPSRDAHGRRIRLSGLLALPRGADAHGLVSYQHGITADPRAVPSNLDRESVAAALLFGGSGHAVLAPDYIGLGVSRPPHPCYVAEDAARAVVDLVAAAQRIPGVPKSAPFLTGFSEGGYASLAAHHALEAAGQQVRGTAVIAGAYNLGTISIPWMLEGRTAQAATSLALLVRGYAQRYGHPLHSAFTPRYATLVPEMLDMGRPAEEIRAALPADPRALFRSDALAALDSKGGHWLADALAANDIGDWALKAPVRFYYGEADIHEPPADPKEAARRLAARGSDTAAISVGAADHGRVTALAAPQILAWLDMLASAKILPLRRRG